MAPRLRSRFGCQAFPDPALAVLVGITYFVLEVEPVQGKGIEGPAPRRAIGRNEALVST